MSARLLDATLHYLGWRGQPIEPDIQERIREALDRCLAAAQPRHIAQAFDAQVGADGVALVGTPVVLTGRSITRHLDRVKKVEVAAFTLGVAVDRDLARHSHTSPATAVLMDAAATAVIEDYCDQIERELKEKYAAEGMSLRPRFSPGYGDLPLALQHPLLSLLDAGRQIGLTCTEANILIPRKSVTAVMGVCVVEERVTPTERCADCAMRDRCDFSRCRRIEAGKRR